MKRFDAMFEGNGVAVRVVLCVWLCDGDACPETCRISRAISKMTDILDCPTSNRVSTQALLEASTV
jgi:hypothetical protein